MAPIHRIVSSLMLALGIVLVVAGIGGALGSTAPGILASVLVVTGLLYAGSLWLGPPPSIEVPAGAETVMVFDRDLHVTAGPGAGHPVLSQFPSAIRPDIETSCRAALQGRSSRFVCDTATARLVIETAPVASVTGVVLYGTLIVSAGLSVPTLAPRPVATAG